MKREGVRDDSFAGMPPLSSSRWPWRRCQGGEPWKMVLIDAEMAHLNGDGWR